MRSVILRVAAGLSAAVFSIASCAGDTALPPAPLRASQALAAAQSSVPLVITEIMVNPANFPVGGSTEQEWIEVFNAGAEAVDLTGYTIVSITSSGNIEANRTITPLPGASLVIQSGSCLVLANNLGTGTTFGNSSVPVAGRFSVSFGNSAVDYVVLRDGADATVDSVRWTSGINPDGRSVFLNIGPTADPTAVDNSQLITGAWALTPADGPSYDDNRNRGTPAQCAYGSGRPPVEVATVAVTPSSATITQGGTQQFFATALDADGAPIADVTFSWAASPSTIAAVTPTGLVTGLGAGDVTVTATAGSTSGSAQLHVLPNLPPVRFTEVHYDNAGTDVGEALEVEGPAGLSLEGWSVVLYNGSGGAAYDTRALSGTIPDLCSGRGVVVVRFEQDGIQNGAPDGFALVNATGDVVEFLSYEGALSASDGPAAGRRSVDIGVRQESSTPHYQTLQRQPAGIWDAVQPSTLGGCYGSAPVTPTNQVSFSGRSPFDAALPVGFEDQLFGTLRAPDDATVPTTFGWESLTPAIASIDADGVFRALSVGTATFRATASDGTTATYSLPTTIATASTTAQYGNHTEFGIPADGDASDDFLLRRTEFTSSFNRVRNIPNWVSYNLEASHITSGQDRCDCFTYDPELPSDFARYTTADYTGAGGVAGFGIDRGHLARSFDRTSGSLDNARTFYFSNIIPQAADNNQGPWADFETVLGNLALNDGKEVYIVTGASGSQGSVKNEGLITIPAITWKVAVVMSRDQGLSQVDSYDDVQVLAVIMPNSPGIRNDDWQTYLTTVNAVEAASGYDVLSLLPDDIERIVEGGLQEELGIIDALETSGALASGVAGSVRSKLVAASESLDRGNVTAARNQLNALLNEVAALARSRRLSAGHAASLSEAITALIRTL